ncbi:MAG TPA: ester cyclase [Acidimicrobiales bacterium]|nr:ester cyclase [Acidimicrobiales bacterium]
MADDNKALVREWLQAVDTGDVGVLDKYLDAGFVDHNPPPFQGPNSGVQGAKDAFNYALGAFSNFRHEVEEQFVDGDRVISRITGYGTHSGEFLGIPPTGKEVRMEGIAIHRVVNGQMVEHWAQVDAAGLLMQLGAMPAPG